MMHVLDYDRALGELLELDDTIRASIARVYSTLLSVVSIIDSQPDLEKIGQLKDTLIVVTADHGHGFVCPLDFLLWIAP